MRKLKAKERMEQGMIDVTELGTSCLVQEASRQQARITFNAWLQSSHRTNPEHWCTHTVLRCAVDVPAEMTQEEGQTGRVDHTLVRIQRGHSVGIITFIDDHEIDSRMLWRFKLSGHFSISELRLNFARRFCSGIRTISFRESCRMSRRESSLRAENVSLSCSDAIFACIRLLILTS